MNGNKLISTFTYTLRNNRHLNPIEFIITAKTPNNLSKSEAADYKKLDNEKAFMSKSVNGDYYSEKDQHSSLNIDLVFEDKNSKTDTNSIISEVSKKSVHTSKISKIIQLGDALPKISPKEPKELVFEKKEHRKENHIEKPSGVIVIAPDGEVVQIGKTLQDEIENFEKIL